MCCAISAAIPTNAKLGCAAFLSEIGCTAQPCKKGGIGKLRREPKEPTWKNCRKEIIVSAVVGLGIAIGVFCLIEIILFRDFAVLKNIYRAARSANISPSEILTMTATALGGLTIGCAAMMKYRKHEWAEYQAEQDSRKKINDEIDAACDSLMKGNCLTSSRAIDKLRRLSEVSSSARGDIAEYLVQYLDCYLPEAPDLPANYVKAAKALASVLRRIIEAKTKKARSEHEKRPLEDVINATKMLCKFVEKHDRIGIEFFQWQNLEADRKNIDGIVLGPDPRNNITNIRFATLKGARLRRASIKNANFIGVCLEGTAFTRAHLEDTDFTNASLKGAFFRGAHLEGAYFCNAHLERADFHGAHLKGANLRDAHLEGADLRGTHLEGVRFLEEAYIDEYTLFDPGICRQYFGKEEPKHMND